MGQLSFTEYFHLLLTGREPTDDQRFFLDLLLVGIAEHGMMPSNVAARMTLAADPGSLQGAVAAGILGCGPVMLGTSEACARLLEEAQARVAAGATPDGRRRRSRARSGRPASRMPGFGHPVHKPLDPRAERILELADARGVSGPHVAARARLPRRGRRGLGQAADDEHLDADRRGAARSRLPGRAREGDPAARRARPACSRTSPRSSEQPLGFAAGRGGRGGDRVRAAPE